MLFSTKSWAAGLLGGLLCGGQVAQAIQLNINDDASIKAAAKQASVDMMKYYVGNQPGQIPGLLTNGYYWWEAGAMFGQLIDYWKLTGDSQYNDIVSQALQFQVGQDNNYMPSNQSKDLGNDDQVFWAFSAMNAAEQGFPNPPATEPSWLALAQAVFNTQVPRWETTTCGGGLRWQIYPFNAGYEYKNTISTGGFFQLSARLARYTGNQTYADWAEKSYKWLKTMPSFSKDYQIWDGTSMNNNCSDAQLTYWTYNVGTLLVGSAYMVDFTNSSAYWTQELNGLLKGTNIFFVQEAAVNAIPGQGGTIMSEVACEGGTPQTCDLDQPSFKAYLTRWMALTAQLVPSTQAIIMPRLQASAAAAAAQCTGQTGTICGRRWYQNGVWDGFSGVGEQMSALSIFQNLLILKAAKPLSDRTGGTSKSDPSAGSGTSDSAIMFDPIISRDMTTGDKAGAGILTALALALILGGTSWMII